MTPKQEAAMKQALEAAEVLKKLIEKALETLEKAAFDLPTTAIEQKEKAYSSITAIRKALAEQPAYKDSTPNLSVGDSSFESWYDQYLLSSPVHQATKQSMRDAYAAGMGDPLVQPAQVDPCIDGSCSCCWTHLDEQPAQPEAYWLIAPDGSWYKNPKHPMNLEQPAQEVDWEKLYRLEVKKKEALAAKYERDTGKQLTRIVPMNQPAQQEPDQDRDRVMFERHWRKTRGEKKASRELPRHPLQPQTYIQDSANRHWVTWQAAIRYATRPQAREPLNIAVEAAEFGAWFDAVWAGDPADGQEIPKQGHKGYDLYMNERTVAFGAWMAAKETFHGIGEKK